MQIDQNILITYGGIAKRFLKGEYIIWEGDLPHFYFQIVEGNVKLYSTNEAGKELIQGTFSEGQSFGAPPLLLGRPYLSTAQATKESIIIKLRKESFLCILNDFPEIGKQLLYVFAERIYDKATSAQIWLAHTPEEKITQLLRKIREKERLSIEYPIPYTRQQIADLSGLRTETVIRTLKRMCAEGKIIIKNHKLYYN